MYVYLYLDRCARSPYPWDNRLKAIAWDIPSRQHPGGARRNSTKMTDSAGQCVFSVPSKLFSGSEIHSREAQIPLSEGQKWSPDRLGTARSGQEHPRSHQNRAKSVPRASQERPRASQELPRDLQEEPKGRPRDSKRRPGDPRRSQKGLQESRNREEIKKKSFP